MDEIDALLSQMRVTQANHLLVAAAFCRRVGLIQTVDRVVPTGMEVGVGTIVQGMVLDTLSGRSPLYRLVEFFEQQDSNLLLGAEPPASAFNDTTVARAMEAICEVGAGKVFSEVAYQAARRFPPDLRAMHWDSTSVNVWGDYRGAGPGSDGLVITHGYSKDHRPDLKQFLLDVLCAGNNVPLLGGCHAGNASDKALNNALLTRVSKDLARFGLGPGDWLYVADSALVTEANLREVADNLFVTRLPFSYSEASRLVTDAVAAGCWQEVGALAETPAGASRPPAQYRFAEGQLKLYGTSYRALVVHSSAHDGRRLKAIERNFSFLKDPLIVNDLFLTKPERIEALGAILLISLLVWNLIEQCLRQHVEQKGVTLPGWDRKETRRPTTFMMTTKFAGFQIVRIGQRYRLAQPLHDVQAAYLRALDLSLDELLPAPGGPP